MTPRTIVCIWLPHFAIQRWTKRRERQVSQAEGDPVREAHMVLPPRAPPPLPAALPANSMPARPVPLVLAREGRHGPVIHGMNRAAAMLGMENGARVTDMRALVPDLEVEDADLAADETDLAALTQWARRWCPATQVMGADALLLDTSGAMHLHGGEDATRADMAKRFAALGLTTRIAAAPTIGAAHALARYGRQASCDAGSVAAALRPLPVAALRIDGDTVTLLGRLGLKTIGALIDLPRDALVRRFRRIDAPARNPLTRLDQALGRRHEAMTAAPEATALRSVMRMAEPLGDADGLETVLGDLAVMLSRQLEERHRGARALCFTAYRVDGSIAQVMARTGIAGRDPDYLTGLFAEKMGTIDPGFGIDAAALEAVGHDEFSASQDDLTGEARENLAIARLIDRLSARLGAASVLRPSRTGSHLPERGEAWVPADPAATPPPCPRPVVRAGRSPLRLLASPEEAAVIHAIPEGPPARFTWRRKTHRVTRTAGPERIAPEWWRAKGSTRLRDYYRVEDEDGRRFWMYREGIAGDGRGGAPRWFVHGIDA